MDKFKIGDKVKVIRRTGYFGPHGLNIGGVYEIGETYLSNGYRLKAVGSSKSNAANFVHEEEIEMYEQKSDFEDQWHLNDGKVEIPDDADKLEKDGSVVAFRKRKVKDLEFGDELFSCFTGTEYRFIRYTNYLKTHCDALNSENMIATNQKLGEQLIRK